MSFLIKDTTKQERAEIIKQALSISMSGADIPTDKTLAIAKEYINGTTELRDVQTKIIQMYNNKRS